MSEAADIEMTPPESEDVKPQRQIGIKTLGLGVIIASLLGACGGAILSKMLQNPAMDISPVTANIEALEAENKTLKVQVTRLQRDIKALHQPAKIDLSDIEGRLKALETANPQEIDKDLVARLEALKEDGSEALDLSDITARIEALETRPAPVTSANVTLAKSIDAVPMPFPEAAILKTLETSQQAGGWLKRSLKKHISVQSEDNPQYLVEMIVQNIEDGNIEAALTTFDKLPAEAKAAGAAWRSSFAD